MKIKYVTHLKNRLKERKIPYSYPKIILKESDNKYRDNVTGRNIAVKRMIYGEGEKNMVIAYVIINEVFEIITIHPVSNSELKNKINSGRWIKNEKN